VPRAELLDVPAVGTLAEVLTGPAHRSDGRTNLAGALRRSMAACGYPTLKELQKAELTITPVHP
jgi:IMP dehydrogenase